MSLLRSDPRWFRTGRNAVDYEGVFQSAIDRLHDEGRYRVFIDILRTKGSWRRVRWRRCGI